ncbi:MAG: MaoC family dehydratase [Chloroflexi bacterium]|nr:MaoC family dehydratase [Chloroflexota bacterium]
MRIDWEGRFLEDFTVGDVYRHVNGRTISETDNTWFTLLTSNTHQIHVNADYAARTEFGRPLVVSTLTLAIVTGLSVADVSQNAVANLGWDNIKLTSPVFAGDTLYASSEVLEVRPSRSRPGQGIVRVRTRGFNQRNETVIEFERSVLVYARAARPERRVETDRDVASPEPPNPLDP